MRELAEVEGEAGYELNQLLAHVQRQLSTTVNNTNTTGLETGAVVAIVAGGSVALVLVVAAAWFVLQRYQRGRKFSATGRAPPSDGRRQPMNVGVPLLAIPA